MTISASPDDLVRLRHADWTLDLVPAVGGSVAGLRWRDTEVLRRAAAGARDPLELAAFPLLPFAGRIADGRFSLGGRKVRLPGNFPPEPHAIHGDGWRAPWQVLASDTASASLAFDHPAGAWPWRYRALQHFALAEEQFTLTLELINEDDAGAMPMPAGLGWHPYFPRSRAHLRAGVTARHRYGSDLLAADAAALDETCDLTHWRPVEDLELDDVYSADGSAELAWPGRRLRLRAQPAPYLVIYVPPDRDFFCVEPISHLPNGINHPAGGAAQGWRFLAPGERLSLAVSLTLSPSPPGASVPPEPARRSRRRGS